MRRSLIRGARLSGALAYQTRYQVRLRRHRNVVTLCVKQDGDATTATSIPLVDEGGRECLLTKEETSGFDGGGPPVLTGAVVKRPHLRGLAARTWTRSMSSRWRGPNAAGKF